MPDRQPVLQSLAAALLSIGSAVLIFKATARGDLCWWTDPIFWIGAAGLTAGAGIFVWLLVPSWLTDRKIRRARNEELLQQGRANQFAGLDEIVRELGGISGQLKAELRWGKRSGGLFPNSAWTKNQHLVTGETKALVESAYEQAHLLDLETLSAVQEDMTGEETTDRQHAKQLVDAAAEAVQELRDEIPL